MGYQVIRQPGSDWFGVFCSYTDRFEIWEATRTEVVEFFMDLAAQRARRDIEQVIAYVESGEPHRAYAQFAMSWEMAVAKDRESVGEMSAEMQETL